MSCWWHQIVRFYTWDGTLDGAFVIVGKGAVSGAIIALVLGAIVIVWSIPQIWREVLAEERAKRLAKQGIGPDDSQPAHKGLAEIRRALGRGWNRGLAEGRAKRLAKQGICPDDSHPAPPPGDVPPTSDI